MASLPKRARKVKLNFDPLSEMRCSIVSDEHLIQNQQCISGMEKEEEFEIEIQKAAESQATDTTHLINVPQTRYDTNLVVRRKRRSAATASCTPYYIISNWYNSDDDDDDFCTANKLSIFTLRTFFTYKAWNQREDMFKKIPGVDFDLYNRMDNYYRLKEHIVKRRMFDCNEILPQLETTDVSLRQTYTCFLSRPPKVATRRKTQIETYAYFGVVDIYHYSQMFQKAFTGIMGKIQYELLDVQGYQKAADDMMLYISKCLRKTTPVDFYADNDDDNNATGQKAIDDGVLNSMNGLSHNGNGTDCNGGYYSNADSDDDSNLDDDFPGFHSVRKVMESEFNLCTVDDYLWTLANDSGLGALTINEAQTRSNLGSLELEDDNDSEVDGSDYGYTPDLFDLGGITKVKRPTGIENEAAGLKVNGTKQTQHEQEEEEEEEDDNEVELGGPPPTKQTPITVNLIDNTCPQTETNTFTKNGAFNAAVNFVLACLDEAARPMPEYVGLAEVNGMIYPCAPLPYFAYHAMLVQFAENYLLEDRDKPTASYDPKLASMTGQEFASRLYSALKDGQVALFCSYASHASMGPDCFICPPDVLRARIREAERFVPKSVNMKNLILDANHLKFDEIKCETSGVRFPPLWEYSEDNLWRIAATLVYNGAYVVRDGVKVVLRLGPEGVVECPQANGLSNFMKVIAKAGRGFMIGCNGAKVLDENYEVVDDPQFSPEICLPSIPRIGDDDDDCDFVVDELQILDRLAPLPFDETDLTFMHGGIDLNLENEPIFYTTQQIELESFKERSQAKKMEFIKNVIDDTKARDVYDYADWQKDKRNNLATRGTRFPSANRCAKAYEGLVVKERK